MTPDELTVFCDALMEYVVAAKNLINVREQLNMQKKSFRDLIKEIQLRNPTFPNYEDFEEWFKSGASLPLRRVK
jgi:hypothetical protein